VWLGLLDVLVPPSPNVHEWFVIVPVDASVKVTFSGAAPLVTLAVKLATGGAFVTVMRLDCVFVDDPSGPTTVKLTENVPAFV
jgi:hypothetical protein